MTALERLADLAKAWSVDVDETRETETSVLGFGSFRGEPVVLKIARRPGDEWRAGEVLDAFQGSGAVRVWRHSGGASLVERATPGESLVELSKSGRDDEATDILADVIRRMSAGATRCDAPSATDWGRSFATYEASPDTQIPRDLVARAASMFAQLCASQASTRLLHGDLHHYNVVRDDARGWLTIDAKGVIAEVEYEIGAVLRNPGERPSMFLDPATIERRVDRFAETLGLDARRIVQWGFAQAVLSTIWDIEDQCDVNHSVLQLATVLERLLSP